MGTDVEVGSTGRVVGGGTLLGTAGGLGEDAGGLRITAAEVGRAAAERVGSAISDRGDREGDRSGTDVGGLGVIESVGGAPEGRSVRAGGRSVGTEDPPPPHPATLKPRTHATTANRQVPGSFLIFDTSMGAWPRAVIVGMRQSADAAPIG